MNPFCHYCRTDNGIDCPAWLRIRDERKEQEEPNGIHACNSHRRRALGSPLSAFAVERIVRYAVVACTAPPEVLSRAFNRALETVYDGQHIPQLSTMAHFRDDNSYRLILCSEVIPLMLQAAVRDDIFGEYERSGSPPEPDVIIRYVPD